MKVLNVLSMMTLALLMFVTEVAATDFNSRHYSALHFRQLALEKAQLYNAPYHIYKSSDGSQWFVYRDHLLRRLGDITKVYALPGALSKYLGRDEIPSIRSAEFQGKILFSYNSQIVYFDPSSDALVSWQDLSSQNDGVTGMQAVGDFELWITTIKGIFTIRSLRDVMQPVAIPEDLMPQNIPTIGAYTLEKGEDGILWIGSFFSSLYRVTVKAGRPPVFTRFVRDGQERMIVYSLRALDQTRLLVGASSGLFEFDIPSGRFTELSDFTEVADINVDDQNIWFTANYRLYLKAKDSAQFSLVRPNEDLGLESEDIHVAGVYTDEEGTVWISVINHGVYHYSPYTNRIKRLTDEFIAADKRVLNLFHLDDENLVYSSSDKTIVVPSGTEYDWMSKSYYRHHDGSYFLGGQGQVTRVDTSGEKSLFDTGRSDIVITSMVVDSHNRLWATADLSGLHRWQLADAAPLSTEQIDSDGVGRARHLTLSSDGNIHVFTSRSIKIFEPGLTQDRLVSALDLHQDIQRIQALGRFVFIFHRDFSISRYDSEQGSLTPLVFDNPERIGCVVNQGDDIWWLAVQGGELVRYDAVSKLQSIYGEKDGIPKGGLSGDWCGIHKGRYYFSSYEGFVRTATNIAPTNTLPPKAVIHQLKSQNLLLKQPVAPEKILLSHRDFPLTLDIYQTSLVFAKANQNRYKLAGLHQDWRYLKPGDQQISIDSLTPGKYQLMLQSSNNDGLWGEQTKLSFEVLPPLWWRWWAKLSYLFGVLLLFYFIYRLRISALHKRAEQLELTVAQRTKTLQQVLELKNREFANVSHELRTPLTLILGPLQKLLSDEKRPQVSNALNVMQRNGYRLLRMVDQLLHLERFRVQRLTERSAVRVKPTVSMLAEAFIDLARDKGIKMRIGHLDDVWLLLCPDVLEKVMLNLLSNAIKYTPEGGKIDVSVRAVGKDKVDIVVSDTGIGIAPEHHASAFERFGRVLDDYSENITGAGIGLALVKELIDSHGGNIDLQSEKGQGSTFTLVLPRYFPAQAEIAGAAQPVNLNNDIVELELEGIAEQKGQSQNDNISMAEGQSDSRSRILVVEDNQDMRHFICDILSSHYRVDCANNGELGLNAAREHIPDLIIADVMMPKMDGFTLCREIKSQQLTCHIPVLLLTARMDRDSKMRGWKEQADEYLTKPFDKEELLLRLENLLAIRQLLKIRFSQQQEKLIETLSDNPEPADDSPLSEWEIQAQAFLSRFNAEIEKNLADADLKVEQLAKNLAMSERQLYRKLKGVLSVTPAEHLRNVRLQKSLTLIRQNEAVGNIAFMVGFSSHSYFCKCFKAKFGKTPSQMAGAE